MSASSWPLHPLIMHIFPRWLPTQSSNTPTVIVMIILKLHSVFKAVSRKANFTVLLAHCSVSCPTHVTRLNQLISRNLSQCMIILTDTGKDGRNQYYSALMKIKIPADVTAAAAVTCYKIPADQHAPFAPYSPYCSNDVRC